MTSINDPLLVNTEINSEGSTEIKYRYFTVPVLRFATIYKCVVFIASVVTIGLWVGGGNDDYFIRSVVKFSFLSSIFDLAIVSSAKLVLMTYLIDAVEDATITARSHRKMKATALYICLLIISIANLAFTAAKGGMILNVVENDHVQLHVTMYIALIWSFAFAIIELFLCFGYKLALQNTQTHRQEHFLDAEGREVDKEGVPVKKKATLARLFVLAKEEKWMLLAGAFCLLFSSGAQTVAPFFFGKVVDSALTSMASLNRTVVELLCIYVVGSIAAMFRSFLFTLAGQRMVARLRKKLFASIIRLEVAFFDVTRTGELTNRLSSDTQVLQNAVTVNISMLLRYLLQIFGSLIFMFALNPSLTGVLLSVVPVIAIGAVQYGRFVQKMRKKFQDRLADASTVAEENISSIRTVRSFNGEEKGISSYGTSIDESYNVGKKLAVASGAFDGTVGIIAYAAVTLVLWYGGKLVNEGILSAGVLTSFLLYNLQVALAFALLSSLYGDFMQAVGASERIFELLDRKPLIPLEGGNSFSEDNCAIQLTDVQFTYPSRKDTKVLKGVTFDVESGAMVALVGPSGGGKSTIVSLLERFYDPEEGEIFIGSRDLKTLDPKWLRSRVCLVSQEPTLFACSIKDNICYGCIREPTLDEVITAAKQANAHNFIEGFEEGYETLVGERGVRLSGGQKQRVAIARALIMNPQILLLDEATSALDAESEYLVQEAIDRAMKNRTVLVIAHRLSTVRDASKVCVIDHGQVVESGTHSELLGQGGVYKRLVLRQLQAGATDPDQLLDLSESSAEKGTEDDAMLKDV